MALSTAFVAGIYGVTTEVNDGVVVLIDSAGQLGTVSSSKRYKEDIKDIKQFINLVWLVRDPDPELLKKYKPEAGSALILENVYLSLIANLCKKSGITYYDPFLKNRSEDPS